MLVTADCANQFREMYKDVADFRNAGIPCTIAVKYQTLDEKFKELPRASNKAMASAFRDASAHIEHKTYLTAAQSMMIMKAHITKDCNPCSDLLIQHFPLTASIADRDRAGETIVSSGLNGMIHTARDEIAAQPTARFFVERPSDTRLVLAAMSKQKRMDKWLSPAQCRLALTLYLQYMRTAAKILNTTAKEACDTYFSAESTIGRRQAQAHGRLRLRGAWL